MEKNSDKRLERWEREREFFDSEEYSEGLIPSITVQRYIDLKKPWLSAEYPFSLLADVAGKRILELGCGDGTKAILLGLKGARVTGIDISERAVRIASRRASLHGIADRVQFTCTPLETYMERSPQEPFDVICGWAVLHHVLPVLGSVLIDLKKLSHRETTFLFSEPIATWSWLRKLRLMLPIPVQGTPDERPLDAGDLAVILHHLPNARLRYFGTVCRVARPLLPDNYEMSSRLARFGYDLATLCDNVLLRAPGAHGLASRVTLLGRMRAD